MCIQRTQVWATGTRTILNFNYYNLILKHKSLITILLMLSSCITPSTVYKTLNILVLFSSFVLKICTKFFCYTHEHVCVWLVCYERFCHFELNKNLLDCEKFLDW